MIIMELVYKIGKLYKKFKSLSFTFWCIEKLYVDLQLERRRKLRALVFVHIKYK